MTSRRQKLFCKVFAPFMAVLVAAIAALCAYAAGAIRAFHFERAVEDLGAHARALALQAGPLIAQQDFAALDALCKQQGHASGVRFTVILPLGAVVADSHEDPAAMDNHRDRPEVVAALRTGEGRSLRYSRTLKGNMLYVAYAIREEGQARAVVRAARSLSALEGVLKTVVARIAAGGVFCALGASLLMLYFSARISQPLKEMTRAADHFAHGDFGLRIPPQDTEELGALADSLNWMAAQLDEKIEMVHRQKNELEAVLEHMVEGVIAVDPGERVFILNRAAAALFGVDAAHAAGRALSEVLRHEELQAFVRRALASAEPIEGEITLREEQDRFFQAHGTRLRSEDGRVFGALVVLHDVTHVRRLENVRRDFVANVSHELKTPLTTIQGFVETLLDGAIGEPDSARRFLEIIARQVRRLNAIVGDLLSLARLEKEAERGEIERKDVALRGVLVGAIEACQHKAKQKEVNVRLACDPGITIRANPELLEQAVVNLLDNAIQYSERGKPVDVAAEVCGGEVRIAVRDEGCGIAPEHLPRLFERFYRVDKARSRTMGGTGLGLSIVKHVAQAHGGTVSVESAPGRGSTFTIHLPRA